MAEYIRRDDLLNYIGPNPTWNGDLSQYETHCAVCLVLSAVRNHVEACESADVEKVVRCKDCRWSREFSEQYVICHNLKVTMPLNGFCSCGEKKDRGD